METKNIYQKLFEVKKAWIKLQRDTTAYNYKYATLSQIQEKLNWEFEKQGLIVIHNIEANAVKTRIVDIESEQKVESIIERVNISVEKHGSEIIAIVAHDDCAGNPVEKEVHLNHLRQAFSNLRKTYPDIDILLLWVPDGWTDVEEIK